MQQTAERYRQFLKESAHSAATIEKYLRNLNRYFQETCPEDRPTFWDISASEPRGSISRKVGGTTA